MLTNHYHTMWARHRKPAEPKGLQRVFITLLIAFACALAAAVTDGGH